MADIENIIVRLRRIEGQVRGICKMIQEEKSTDEIISQISAVRAALFKVGVYLAVSDYTKVKSPEDKDKADEIIRRISKAV